MLMSSCVPLSGVPWSCPFGRCTLTALPQDKVQHFHQHLSSIETTIQFTVEMESESTLPFLDTRITHHSDGSLSTTAFRKSTRDKYWDFQSRHPLAHKVAVARTLFDHAMKICSDFPDSKNRTCCKGAPEQWLPQKTCNEELARLRLRRLHATDTCQTLVYVIHSAHPLLRRSCHFSVATM